MFRYSSHSKKYHICLITHQVWIVAAIKYLMLIKWGDGESTAIAITFYHQVVVLCTSFHTYKEWDQLAKISTVLYVWNTVAHSNIYGLTLHQDWNTQIKSELYYCKCIWRYQWQLSVPYYTCSCIKLHTILKHSVRKHRRLSLSGVCMHCTCIYQTLYHSKT